MLWVNADDFGADVATSEAILGCVREGLVNSVSVLPFPDSDLQQLELLRTLVRDYPHVAIGAHLSLIESTPVLDTTLPQRPHRRGHFPPDFRAFLLQYLACQWPYAKVKAEWRAQLELLQARITSYRQQTKPASNSSGSSTESSASAQVFQPLLAHIDSHQHVHVLPGLWRAARELQVEFAIARLRIPYESWWRGLFHRFPFGAALQSLALYRKRTHPGISIDFAGFFTSTHFTAKAHRQLWERLKQVEGERQAGERQVDERRTDESQEGEGQAGGTRVGEVQASEIQANESRAKHRQAQPGWGTEWFAMLGQRNGKDLELMVHPGYDDSRVTSSVASSVTPSVTSEKARGWVGDRVANSAAMEDAIACEVGDEAKNSGWVRGQVQAEAEATPSTPVATTFEWRELRAWHALGRSLALPGSGFGTGVARPALEYDALDADVADSGQSRSALDPAEYGASGTEVARPMQEHDASGAELARSGQSRGTPDPAEHGVSGAEVARPVHEQGTSGAGLGQEPDKLSSGYTPELSHQVTAAPSCIGPTSGTVAEQGSRGAVFPVGSSTVAVCAFQGQKLVKANAPHASGPGNPGSTQETSHPSLGTGASPRHSARGEPHSDDFTKDYFAYESSLGRGRVAVCLREIGRPDLQCHVLDLGCGYGGVLAGLAEVFPNWTGLGVDCDAQMVASGQARMPPGMNLIQADFLADDFDSVLRPESGSQGEEHFDVVLLRDVLEHCIEVEKALHRAAVSLKPGGWAYITYAPFDGPFGGHQHNGSSLLSRLPWVQHLPESWIRPRLKPQGNSYKSALALEADMDSVFRTRLAYDRVVAAGNAAGLQVERQWIFLSRPEYRQKLGLPSLPIPNWSWLRDWAATGVEILAQRPK